MKKYVFVSYSIFADSEDEAWDIIQESISDNEITDCFTCNEGEITINDIKECNLLGLNNKQLNNLKEENLQDYLEELDKQQNNND